jgi:beta-aspartyl-dipeptidase (metallo-type)
MANLAMADHAPLTLFTGGDVLLPTGLERIDVLVAGEQIHAVGALEPATDAGWLVERRDSRGLTLIPGLVDAHAHILGGGGGDGYATRIPELRLTDMTTNGITTVVGAPGIEMVSRSMEGLLAKARALTVDGISAFLYIGGFRHPILTLTGSVWRDAYLLADVVGVKLAVGDGRAASIDPAALVDLARDLAWAERARGQRLVLHLHLGTDGDGPRQVRDVLARAPLPGRFVITHCNWTPASLEAAASFVADGAYADVTTLLDPKHGVDGAVRPADAVARLLDGGADASRVSMSTDGNGHVPAPAGDAWEPYDPLMHTLLAQARALVTDHGADKATALRMVTETPSMALGIDRRKGRIAPGADADLLLLDDEMRVVGVYCRGREMVRDGQALVRDRFEVRQRADR